MCDLLYLLFLAAVNVALRKPIYRVAKWPQSATDGNVHTMTAAAFQEFSYWYVDLKAIYNLTRIELYAHDVESFREFPLFYNI